MIRSSKRLCVWLLGIMVSAFVLASCSNESTTESEPADEERSDDIAQEEEAVEVDMDTPVTLKMIGLAVTGSLKNDSSSQ